MRYTTILFDLDGTLIDSKKGIVESVDFSLRKFNIIGESLERFIGPPIKDSFKEFYPSVDAEKAVQYYREHFVKKGMFANTIYPGIPEILKDINVDGKKALIATSKPYEYTIQILNHLGLKPYFTHIIGATLDGKLSKKEDIIRKALSLLHCKKSEVVMVGDKIHDIYGAFENGIDSIFVEYGYGTIEELKNYRPTYRVKTVNDLRKILLKRSAHPHFSEKV